MQRDTAKSMLANGKVISLNWGWVPDSVGTFTDFYYQPSEDENVRVARFDDESGEQLFDSMVMANGENNIYSLNEMRKKNDHIDWMDADESPVAEKVAER